MGNQASASSVVSLSYCGECLDSRYQGCHGSEIKRSDSIVITVNNQSGYRGKDPEIEPTILVSGNKARSVYFGTGMFDRPLFGDIEDEVIPEDAPSNSENKDKSTNESKAMTSECSRPGTENHDGNKRKQSNSGIRSTEPNLAANLSFSSQTSEIDYTTEARSEHSIQLRNNSICERDDVEEGVCRNRGGEPIQQRNQRDDEILRSRGSADNGAPGIVP